MNKGFAALAVIGTAAAVATFAINSQTAESTQFNADSAFVKYITEQGKSYATKEEFEFRQNLFKQSQAIIAKENSKNGNSFTLGLNKFSDMTD